MSKKIWIGVVVLAVGAGAWAVFLRNGSSGPDVEYRYAEVKQDELIRSISATGQIVALTTVDVKSKAGGKILQLAVQEGAVVKKGDLIAVIDPADTKARYDQAEADLTSAQAQAEQARTSARLQELTQKRSVEEAETALDLAKVRLAKAEEQAKLQPKLSESSIQNAEEALNAQRETLKQLEQVTVPQERRDAQGQLLRAQADFAAAKAELDRQKTLITKGYTSQSDVERAESTHAAALATLENAKTRSQTLEANLASQVSAQKARVRQAEVALEQAQANRAQDTITQKSLDEARRAVKQAEIGLQRAKDEKLQIDIRQADTQSAQSAIVRNKVNAENAKVNYDDATVYAPRDGVVTLKYLEEGTIIPPGTSTFAQGTSIVQISDTTTLFVECAVDEADISQVQAGQNVRIIVEAFPGAKISGQVERVNPAATTTNNITAVKVRVKISPDHKELLLPGMTATCEFLTLEKNDVLTVPTQAVKREGGKTYVQVKPKIANAKPERREVKVGELGNDAYELISGVKAGEQVVVAEINLKELRETQQRMIEAQQGGGLAGGPMSSRPQRPSGGGAGGGGARGGGGR